MDFKETLKVIKEQEEYKDIFESFPELKDDPIFKFRLSRILEVMYKFSGQDGFNQGRLNTKEEMAKYMELQKKQMDLLESISRNLKNK